MSCPKISSKFAVMLLAAACWVSGFFLGMTYQKTTAKPIDATAMAQTAPAHDARKTVQTSASVEKQAVASTLCLDQVARGNFLCLSSPSP